MAQKKITDLTLRSDFDATCNLPVDDAVQTWRTTGAQMKEFLDSLEVISKVANFTLTTEDVATGDSSGGAFTFTLPAASSRTKRLVLKKTDSSFTAISIARAGSDTIDGATSTSINTQNETLVLVSDGVSGWFVESRSYPKVTSSYSPTISGLGTPSSVAFSWRRDGDTIHILGSLVSGIATAAETQLGLPSGLTSHASVVANQVCGAGGRGTVVSGNTSFDILAQPSVSYLNVGLYSTGGVDALAPQQGASILTSGDGFSMFASVRIAGWN